MYHEAATPFLLSWRTTCKQQEKVHELLIHIPERNVTSEVHKTRVGLHAQLV